MLNRGSFDWPNRSETQRFLFDKIREHGKFESYDHKRSPDMGALT